MVFHFWDKCVEKKCCPRTPYTHSLVIFTVWRGFGKSDISQSFSPLYKGKSSHTVLVLQKSSGYFGHLPRYLRQNGTRYWWLSLSQYYTAHFLVFYGKITAEVYFVLLCSVSSLFPWTSGLNFPQCLAMHT